jgi:signal transduction histidine kinase
MSGGESASLAREVQWIVIVAVALLLFASGGISWWLVRSSEFAALDAALAVRARAALALCEWETASEEGEEAGERAENDIGVGSVRSDDLRRGRVECELDEARARGLGVDEFSGLEVFALPSGVSLFRAAGRGGAALDAALALPGGRVVDHGIDAGAARFETRSGVRRCIQSVRIASSETGELPPPDAGAIVVAAESIAPIQARLRDLAWILGGVGTAAVAIAFAVGRFVSSRVTAPLAALAAAAERVAAGAAAEVPRRARGDEVDRLASCMDRAFAAQAEALARQARFTADAAHELRNPIAAIRASAEVAGRQPGLDAEVRGLLDDVVETTARLGATMEALLELARLDAGARGLDASTVDLVELASRAADDPRVRVVSEGPVTVSGDRRLLAVAIRNLVENALRHARSSVQVHVERAASGDGVLRVVDDGPGLSDPATAPELFRRFQRERPRAEGAGLGLAIVAEIAAAHGGEVAFEHPEAPTSGASVRLLLPVDPRPER